MRDYIHVEDLADAHLRALDYLRDGGTATTLNCGYGHGYSVREVLRTVERVHGAPLRIREAPRRAGDPPMLVANASRVRQALNWSPRYDDLETIVRTQLEWERRLCANRCCRGTEARNEPTRMVSCGVRHIRAPARESSTGFTLPFASAPVDREALLPSLKHSIRTRA